MIHLSGGSMSRSRLSKGDDFAMNIVNITLGVDTQPCSSITLGRRGENEVTQVVIDFSSWVEEFGAGVITLLAMRSQDTSAYPVVLTLDGNTATWDVTSTDTAYKGSGRAEYIYTVGEQIAKSVVFNTVVMQDIGEPSETPPDPYEDWLERLTELGAETQANAEAAQQSAENAAESAQEAAGSATSAEGYAGQAETAAGLAQAAQTASEAARDAAQTAQASAEASATVASGSAASAASSATAAAGSASDASASATAAGASATAASASATTASNAATAAQTAQSAAEDAAEDAQQAAQQAHVEYEQLSGEVDDLSDEVTQQKSAIEQAPTEETGQELLTEEELNTLYTEYFLKTLDRIFSELPQDESLSGIVDELVEENSWLDQLYREVSAAKT